jgi:predicted MFS family arabinose efflux permease
MDRDVEPGARKMIASVRRAVWFLGAGQCVYWGTLYYGFSVLLVPMASEFHSSRPVIAGAFSLALLVMALVSPQIGRWVDRGRAAWVMRVGACVAVAAVVAASQITGVYSLYVVWAVMGAGMAALFYEPVFGLVIRNVSAGDDRLRALASVTVLGGLASTIFLPAMAFTLRHLGWRGTELVIAALILVASWSMQRYVLPAFPPHAAAQGGAAIATAHAHVSRPATFAVLAIVFVSSMTCTLSLTTLFIPIAVERGHSATTAAAVLAALGVMQLPGRVWLLRGGRSSSIRGLLALQLVLQGLGMMLVAWDGWLGVTAVGVACYGAGAGLHTLNRPWAVQSIYGVSDAGRVNGIMARYEGFARAGGPVIAALLYEHASARSLFGGLSLALLAMVPIAWIAIAPRSDAPTCERG